MTDNIDAAIALDKPGLRSLTTTSQLQAQIDLCADELITPQQFYIYVAFELGTPTLDDWEYLSANNCVPSREMLRLLLTKIDGWQVVDTSKLHHLIQAV